MPFEIVRNDITKMHFEVIVNPRNAKFFGTVGVYGAIHKIEGSELKEQTEKIGELESGKSKR